MCAVPGRVLGGRRFGLSLVSSSASPSCEIANQGPVPAPHGTCSRMWIVIAKTLAAGLNGTVRPGLKSENAGVPIGGRSSIAGSSLPAGVDCERSARPGAQV